MDKATEARLTELKRQKEEIESYRVEHRKEFGPTADEILDWLNDYLVECRHMEIDLVWVETGGVSDMYFQDDTGCMGTDLKDLLTGMMEVSK